METSSKSPHREVLEKLVVTTPGRICLFGEHQDYLNLPVIATAISLRMTMEGKRRTDSEVRISLPDISSSESFSLQGELLYTKPKEYFRSAVNILRKAGFTFSTGFDCVVRSTIPIQAGTSSSSALVVSWVDFLLQMNDNQIRVHPYDIARYAYEAEVLELGEAGGMMDQYSTACGGILAIDFFPDLFIEPLNVQLKGFVLGDSGEIKDTQEILVRVKAGVTKIVRILTEKYPDFSLHSLSQHQLPDFKQDLTEEQFILLEGTILNRDITRQARETLRLGQMNHKRIGELLTKHHTVLRDVQRISTPKIDRMIDAALNAGAYGGKINGSGGGGCMFAYAPENPEMIAEAIERAGGKAYIVSVDSGVRSESMRTSK